MNIIKHFSIVACIGLATVALVGIFSREYSGALIAAVLSLTFATLASATS